MHCSDTYHSARHCYSLGIEQHSGRPYLAIPVSNALVDYEEYYALSPAQYQQFHASPELAAAFADDCRHRQTMHFCSSRPASSAASHAGCKQTKQVTSNRLAWLLGQLHRFGIKAAREHA